MSFDPTDTGQDLDHYKWAYSTRHGLVLWPLTGTDDRPYHHEVAEQEGWRPISSDGPWGHFDYDRRIPGWLHIDPQTGQAQADYVSANADTTMAAKERVEQAIKKLYPKPTVTWPEQPVNWRTKRPGLERWLTKTADAFDVMDTYDPPFEPGQNDPHYFRRPVLIMGTPETPRVVIGDLNELHRDLQRRSGYADTQMPLAAAELWPTEWPDPEGLTAAPGWEEQFAPYRQQTAEIYISKGLDKQDAAQAQAEAAEWSEDAEPMLGDDWRTAGISKGLDKEDARQQTAEMYMADFDPFNQPQASEMPFVWHPGTDQFMWGSRHHDMAQQIGAPLAQLVDGVIHRENNYGQPKEVVMYTRLHPDMARRLDRHIFSQIGHGYQIPDAMIAPQPVYRGEKYADQNGTVQAPTNYDPSTYTVQAGFDPLDSPDDTTYAKWILNGDTGQIHVWPSPGVDAMPVHMMKMRELYPNPPWPKSFAYGYLDDSGPRTGYATQGLDVDDQALLGHAQAQGLRPARDPFREQQRFTIPGQQLPFPQSAAKAPDITDDWQRDDHHDQHDDDQHKHDHHPQVDSPTRAGQNMRTADYNGWTNWDTWHTSLMIDNERQTYQEARQLAGQGNKQAFITWVIQSIIGPENRERIAEAKEWNSIPPEERIDEHYEDMREQNPQAADLYDQIGDIMGFGGPNIGDDEPNLIDPNLVNWDELWGHLVEELEEERRHEQGLPPTWQAQPDPDKPGDFTLPDEWTSARKLAIFDSLGQPPQSTTAKTAAGQVMYHISPREHRESILATGLNGHKRVLEEGEPLQRHYRDDPWTGVFGYSHVPHDFVASPHYDVWQIDTTGLPLELDNSPMQHLDADVGKYGDKLHYRDMVAAQAGQPTRISPDRLTLVSGHTAAAPTRHWAYVDGHVAFHDLPWEAMSEAAHKAGHNHTIAQALSNFVARSLLPKGYNVAWGRMANSRPWIYASTVDRNHVWEQVTDAAKAQDNDTAGDRRDTEFGPTMQASPDRPTSSRHSGSDRAKPSGRGLDSGGDRWGRARDDDMHNTPPSPAPDAPETGRPLSPPTRTGPRTRLRAWLQRHLTAPHSPSQTELDITHVIVRTTEHSSQEDSAQAPRHAGPILSKRAFFAECDRVYASVSPRGNDAHEDNTPPGPAAQTPLRVDPDHPYLRMSLASGRFTRCLRAGEEEGPHPIKGTPISSESLESWYTAGSETGLPLPDSGGGSSVPGAPSSQGQGDVIVHSISTRPRIDDRHGGIWWKGIYNRDTDQSAIWVPDREGGGPHHLMVAGQLGWAGDFSPMRDNLINYDAYPHLEHYDGFGPSLKFRQSVDGQYHGADQVRAAVRSKRIAKTAMAEYRIDAQGWVYVGRASVGRIIDGKPHTMRWIAKDRAGRTTRHFTRAEAAAALAAKWTGEWNAKTAMPVDPLPDNITYRLLGSPKLVQCLYADTPEFLEQRVHAAYICWHADGEIKNIYVQPELRRMGLATELLRRAREINPNVHHSDQLSDDAEGWSQSVSKLADVVPNGSDLPFKPGDRVQIGGTGNGEFGTVIEVEPPAEDYVPDECEMCGMPTEDNLDEEGLCRGCFNRPHEHDPTVWVTVKLDSGKTVRAGDSILRFVQGMEGGNMPGAPPSRWTHPGPDSPDDIDGMVRNAAPTLCPGSDKLADYRAPMRGTLCLCPHCEQWVKLNRFGNYVKHRPAPQTAGTASQGVPPAPGTIPIPANHVRLYHYTGAPEGVINQEGLRMDRAKGESYGEPNVIWASTRQPREFKRYVEFSVAHDDPRLQIGKYQSGINYGYPDGQDYSPEGWAKYMMAKGSDVTLHGDVRPEELIGVHEPWHHTLRYLIENQIPLADVAWMEQTQNMPDEARAVGEYRKWLSQTHQSGRIAGESGNVPEGYEIRPAAEAPKNPVQAMLDANRGDDLRGLPTATHVPGMGRLEFGSNRELQQIAQQYMANRQMPFQPPRNYRLVDPREAQAVARAYDFTPHSPNDPHVRASYKAFQQETLDQYRHLLNNGYRMGFYPRHDPYPNSPREALLDLHQNKHLYVYPTAAGFGQDDVHQDHPLLGDSGVRWQGKPVTYNDLFRGVHDVFGHAKEGVGFRWHGEDNAWRQHAAMYSPLARGAMTAETRGQNSWVNFGPHGEQNQTADTPGTIFAEQKAVVLPPWAQNIGDDDSHPPMRIGHIAGDLEERIRQFNLERQQRQVERQRQEQEWQNSPDYEPHSFNPNEDGPVDWFNQPRYWEQPEELTFDPFATYDNPHTLNYGREYKWSYHPKHGMLFWKTDGGDGSPRHNDMIRRFWNQTDNWDEPTGYYDQANPKSLRHSALHGAVDVQSTGWSDAKDPRDPFGSKEPTSYRANITPWRQGYGEQEMPQHLKDRLVEEILKREEQVHGLPGEIVLHDQRNEYRPCAACGGTGQQERHRFMDEGTTQEPCRSCKGTGQAAHPQFFSEQLHRSNNAGGGEPATGEGITASVLTDLSASMSA